MTSTGPTLTDEELAEHLTVQTSPDSDDEHLLYFLRNGATAKCGYVFSDSAIEVQEWLTRVVAALQESRAEVTRLQRIVDSWGKLEFSSRWAGPAS